LNKSEYLPESATGHQGEKFETIEDLSAFALQPIQPSPSRMTLKALYQEKCLRTFDMHLGVTSCNHKRNELPVHGY
jgi:hypothetical protein